MIKITLCAVLLVVRSLNGIAQVSEDKITSDGTIDLLNSDVIRINDIERIELPLYMIPYLTPPTDVMLGFPGKNDSIVSKDRSKYNFTYGAKPIEIVDSIDINCDGIKELFLFRQANCYITPFIKRPFGIGDQSQRNGKYEVWDLKAKKKLFEIWNIRENRVIVSTNVIHNSGYHFDVKLDKEGNFYIPGPINGSDYKPGMYTYNLAKHIYEVK